MSEMKQQVVHVESQSKVNSVPVAGEIQLLVQAPDLSAIVGGTIEGSGGDNTFIQNGATLVNITFIEFP
jgi:hypothetical protein